MSISNPLNTPPKIWHNGVLVEEHHLDASGNPPPVEQSLSDEWTPLPLSDHYSGIIDGFTVGIHQRLTSEGVLQAKSWAYAVTDHEDLLESDIYRLVPEADYQPFNPADTSHSFPVAAMGTEGAVERAERRVYARAMMGPNDRSVLDMIQIARSLQSDARLKEKTWQVAQEKLMEERRLDLEAIELYKKVERGRALMEEKNHAK